MDFRNVKSLMIGGKPVAKLLVGGRLAWQKAKPEPEPEPVVGEYIETDGVASYMDLGFVPSSGTTYSVDFYWESGYVMGANTRNPNRITSFAIGSSSGYLNIYRPSAEALVVAGRHEVSYDGNSILVDGDSYQLSASATNAERTLVIGQNGLNTYYGKVKFYSAKFWESGVLIRDLVPYSGPRGVGLLDKVNDVLYTNAGGGSLTYGVESQLPEDRLEVTFDLGIDVSVGEAVIPIACRNWPIDGRFVGTAYYGIGDPYEFEQVAAPVGRTWKQFTNYSGDELPDRGEYTRWLYGVGEIQLNFGYVLFTAPAKRCIKVLRIPTYAVMNTCTGSFPNCSDITFVGRSRAEAVAMHAGMQSAFASATWHCTDGDYVGGVA